MSHEDESTAVLVRTKNPLEAETIVAALRERGVDARVADSASTNVFGGAVGSAKVIVLESQLDAAREALEELRRDVGSIDWATVDVGSIAPPLPGEGSATRRALWTVTILLIPLSLVVVSVGVNWANRMVQAIGVAVLLGALIVGGNLMVTGSRRSGANR